MIIKNELVRKGLVLVIILLFTGTFAIPSLGGAGVEKNSNPPMSGGNTLFVGGSGPGNYTKIQDAIDNASEGDTIFVYTGTYFENILLWKSVNLIGENRKNTIIFPRNVELNENSTIYISVDNCSINGFTINNNNFETDVIGIFIHSSGNMIFDNSILRFKYGVYLKDENFEHVFTGNNISRNEISNCTSGIYLRANAEYNTINRNYIIDNLEGIIIYYCENNTIQNNFVHSNTVYGIYININSDGNIVSRNICSENRYGIRFKAVSYNEIFLNRLEKNELGLYSCCGSHHNILYFNSLIDNEKNASDGFYNFWDNGIVGNYWEDYNGTDNDGDGIGDTPYPIPDGNNVDRYPLMEPIDNNPPDGPVIDGPPSGKAGDEYCLTVHSTDLDGDDVFYLIDWGDGTTSGWLGPFPQCEPVSVCHKFKRGTYNIRAKVKDIYGFESDWSEPLFIEIPRTRVVYHPFLLRLFELFPILERLLNLLR